MRTGIERWIESWRCGTRSGKFPSAPETYPGTGNYPQDPDPGDANDSSAASGYTAPWRSGTSRQGAPVLTQIGRR